MHRRAFFPIPEFSACTPGDRHPVPEGTLPDGDLPPLRPLGIRAGLEAYAAPLDRPRAAHLLRRTGFGADPAEVDALVGLDAETAVTLLVDDAVGQPLPEPPPWINEPLPPRSAGREARDRFIQNNQQWMLETRTGWFERLYFGGLRERMTLFWHNHFVTEIDAYLLAPYAYRYLTTLRTHALGNFRAFVHAVGTDPAMLLYLNGNQNVADAPNENYARELLELFTMGPSDAQGQPNYTQQDVEQVARALTGWVADPYTLTVQLVSIFHDHGEKTIFGRTGPWGYDDVVDLLFEERAPQIAAFLARKLYRAFVYAVPDEALVTDLAGVFLASDFEIAPVMRTLLTSAHFLDDQAIGAQIKMPVALVTSQMRDLHVQHPPRALFRLFDRLTFLMQQNLFDPPNVAGWEGHHTWLNTSTYPLRLLVSDALLFGGRDQMPLDLVPLAETLLAGHDEPVSPDHPRSAFVLPVALAEHLLPVPPEALDLVSPSDDFAGDLINNPIPEDLLNGPPLALNLAKIFLAGVPWYEWSLYQPAAPSRLLAYTRFLLQRPEFQLT